MSEALWLESAGLPDEPAGRTLRRLLQETEVLAMPGAHDVMSGLLAKRAGFRSLYLSGAALTASMGLPDLGILTMEELVSATRRLWRATGLPILVDGDTGYGEALNVMRLVRELEDAGAAAIQLEDQELPKKCGHLNDKRLVPAEEMAAKIAAAKRASRDLLVVARTDAAAESMEAAIERIRLYADAGADVIFPEAMTSRERMRQVRAATDLPLLGNMTEFGRTPQLSLAQWGEVGFDLVIWPVSSLRIAAKAVEAFYGRLMAEGTAEPMLGDMQTRAELYETIGYFEFEALDSSIARSVLPTVEED